MKIIGKILVIFIVSFIGIKYFNLGSYSSVEDLALFSVALVIVNLLIKPIVKFVSLPITCLTFGIFSLVINVLMIFVATYFVPGVSISGFISAMVLTIAISIATTIVHLLF
ncbi:phage holin family protein [uncultured Clostridium sp.]|jgi:putative membrane protein|uniref:phage holin family protein n=1 Tax=uncultured Clostridium sp. TaxID=59620 RepID=UPI00260C3704|nr:phage holin family protein [uncultured Clostridium sp.]